MWSQLHFTARKHHLSLENFMALPPCWHQTVSVCREAGFESKLTNYYRIISGLVRQSPVSLSVNLINLVSTVSSVLSCWCNLSGNYCISLSLLYQAHAHYPFILCWTTGHHETSLLLQVVGATFQMGWIWNFAHQESQPIPSLPLSRSHLFSLSHLLSSFLYYVWVLCFGFAWSSLWRGHFCWQHGFLSVLPDLWVYNL